jgi:hypothetical protein
MPYVVKIRRNSDGLEREIRMLFDWSASDLFWWTDGNFGCDCNRHLEFERAEGCSPEFAEAVCGESAYTAVQATLPDGSIVAIDSRSSNAPASA